MGLDFNLETILTAHIVTDEDGSLKIKEIEEFADSKTFLDFLNDIAEAKAAGRHSASFAA